MAWRDCWKFRAILLFLFFLAFSPSLLFLSAQSTLFLSHSPSPSRPHLSLSQSLLHSRPAALPSPPPTSSTESAPESDQRGNNWRSVSLFRNIRRRRRCRRILRPSPNRLFPLLFSPGFFKAIASFFFANAPLLFRSLPVVWKLASVTVAALCYVSFFSFTLLFSIFQSRCALITRAYEATRNNWMQLFLPWLP